MRCLGFMLAVAVVLGAVSPPGHCEEDVPNALRVNAEHAFLDGRQQDLPVILDAATSPRDVFPLLLARAWWRRTPSRDSIEALEDGLPKGGSPVDAARLRWALAGGTEPPYPRPAGGGAKEPYPLIAALIDDRIQRETVGAQGLPEGSPLQHYLDTQAGGRTGAEADVIQFALAMQRRSYHGDEDPAYEQGLDKAARTQANLNKVVYLGLLGALIAGGFIATLFAGRDRRGEA